MIIHLNSAITNVSLQVGDIAYYTVTSTNGSVEFGSNPTFIGLITEVSNSYIRVADNSFIPENAFILFAKNNVVNSGSLKGYFAEVTMRNDDTSYCELFAISSEVDQSSK